MSVLTFYKINERLFLTQNKCLPSPKFFLKKCILTKAKKAITLINVVQSNCSNDTQIQIYLFASIKSFDEFSFKM